MEELKRAFIVVVEPKMCAAIINGQKTLILTTKEPAFEYLPATVYIACGEKNTDNPNEILEIHNSNGKIIKANGKIVGKFTCYNVDRYETEFSEGNSLYQSIGKIKYDEDDEDEEKVIITTNEDDNPDDNELCKFSLKSFEEIKTMCGATDAEFWSLQVEKLVIYDSPIEPPAFDEHCVLITETPSPTEQSETVNEEDLAEIERQLAAIAEYKENTDKEIFTYIHKLRKAERIMRKLYVLKGYACATRQDCTEYNAMLGKAIKAKKGYEKHIAALLKDSGKYEACLEFLGD